MKSLNLGHSILTKMGWNGKGLGKFEQGIVKPLYTKIVGKKGEAKIINENQNYDFDSYYIKKENYN